MSGLLSVVATPIGNLEDITLRALRTLREAEVILAEDTRRTLTLCRHHGIGGKLRTLHAHTPPARVASIVEELAAGARFALVSDAGTPLVSDPGAELVRAALEAGVRVESIPGPSAPVSALVASGLASPSFAFFGFLPRSGGKRSRALEVIGRFDGTAVLFEAPSRVGDTLRDLARTLGAERPAAVCRELTKLHEEVARGTLAELGERFSGEVLGEITLVVGPPASVYVEAKDPIEDDEIRRWLEGEGLGTKEAAERLASHDGIARKDAYRRVLDLAKASGGGA